jgi:hypothetical protein
MWGYGAAQPTSLRYCGGGSREWCGAHCDREIGSPDRTLSCRLAGRVGAKGEAGMSYHLQLASGDQKKLHLLTKPLI